MPWFLVAAMAIGWWIGTWRRRRRTQDRNRQEVEATLGTGLPSPETAVGQKAKAVADAQQQKLADPPPIHGSARWATEADAAPLLDALHVERAMRRGSNGLYLGTLMEDGGFEGGIGRDTRIPVVARYPGHLLTVAGTGQGKSATQIIANLLTYRGSVVVLDPKGELYAATAEKRRRFGKVFRIAPLARRGEPPSDRYNPLDEMGDARELGSRAQRLAEMLIVRQGGKGAGDATFFENEAVNLLTALIMFVVESSEEPRLRRFRTLSEVRRICTLPMLAGKSERSPTVREYIEDVFLKMAEVSRYEHVKRQGTMFQGYDAKLLGSFLSEINSNLAFWDAHPGFAEATARSDFTFADLERETVTVYLTIPFKDMTTSFRFLRAMIGMAFAALEEKQEAREASVLFVLDEFAALRDMEFMREAVAQMRSSGAWFWIFVQDVAQLEAVYGRWADVFLSQTDHQVFFGGTLDTKTRKYISTLLGVTTFPYRDASVSWAHTIGLNDGVSEQPIQMGGVNHGRSVGQSVNISEPVMLAPRPLLNPFDVGTFLSAKLPGETHASTAIIFSKQAGGFPIKAHRRHWRDMAELTERLEPSRTALEA